VDEADDLRWQRDLRQLVQHRNDALRAGTMSHNQYEAQLQSMQPVSIGSAGCQQICIISGMSGCVRLQCAPKSGGQRTPQRTGSAA
jgi:hypothetical protein